MTSLARGSLLLLTLTCVGSPTLGQPPSPVVILRMYDNASLPAATDRELRAATELAFAPTGIRIDWRQCADASTTRHAGCTLPQARREVVVRVVDAHRTAGTRHCGFAVPTSAAGFVSLSRECASRTANVLRRKLLPWEKEIATEGEILGYTLAHELAHVLLPGRPHSSEGLFRAQLYRRHWRRVRTRQLSFLSSDIERLREAAIQWCLT